MQEAIGTVQKMMMFRALVGRLIERSRLTEEDVVNVTTSEDASVAVATEGGASMEMTEDDDTPTEGGECKKGCDCCSKVSRRTAPRYDWAINCPAFLEERTDTDGFPFVVTGSSKCVGGPQHKNGRKYEPYDQVIQRFVKEKVTPLCVEMSTTTASIENLRKKVLFEFQMNCLLGTCPTRRGAHCLSFNFHSIKWMIQEAQKNAAKSSPKVRLVVKDAYERPPLTREAVCDQVVDAHLQCGKDSDDKCKACDKFFSLRDMADNTMTIASLFERYEATMPPEYQECKPFKDVIADLRKWSQFIYDKILEIAHMIDSKVVACCPKGRGCNYFIRPLIRVPERYGRRYEWGLTKDTYCPTCGVYFCSDCGIELHPEEEARRPHVCDQRAKFQALPAETKEEIMSKLGTQYQFCPECNAVQEWSGGCSKLTCHMCRCYFCLECGDKLDGLNYLQDHLIILRDESIPCRFLFVYKGCRTYTAEKMTEMGEDKSAKVKFYRQELIRAIENGGSMARKIEQDLRRIADENERYPAILHQCVAEVLSPEIRNLFERGAGGKDP